MEICILKFTDTHAADDALKNARDETRYPSR
jgi:hypothetical protein